MNNGRFNTLNKYVFDIQKQVNATAAAIYIIQNNTVVNEVYSGRHDFEPLSRLVNPQSQFNVGSVRKTYLAFAISLLIELGVYKPRNYYFNRYGFNSPQLAA